MSIRKLIIIAVSVMISVLSLSHCDNTKPKELYFFCGAAARVPMDEIIKNYEKETGIKVSVIYSGSGGLLSQMELTEKGDVYLCGSPDYIIIGENKKLLIKNTSQKVAYLIPAIIVPKENPAKIQSLEDLTKPGVRVGMGNPEVVCLGLYGIELLDYNKIMEKVLPNVVVYAKSCEDAAMLAVLGKVDAILGWDVFESWNPKEVEWIKISPEKIPRLAYIAIAIPVFAKDIEFSKNFINYVIGDKGKKTFDKWGYISDEGIAKKYAPKAEVGGEYKLPEKYYKIIRHEK